MSHRTHDIMLVMIARSALLVRKVWRRVLMTTYRPLFQSHGKNFWFDPKGLYSFGNIRVGDDVFLGERPLLMATVSEIRIGSKVMFGPEVVILGGDHNTSVVGKFMYDVEEKRPGDDQPVIIEDDVWIGARAIILKGVTIGRGAIIGAGAVVSRSVPPYAVAVGSPARVVKFRWDIDTILRHEESLYPVERRLSRERVTHFYGDIA